MKAIVYRSTGSWYNIKTETGKAMSARIKGVFKIDDITSTNPIAVGDEVVVDIESESANTAIITEILPRRNYINRQSPAHKKQHHIVAANLDQSLLFATLREPKTSQGFIDRFGNIIIGAAFNAFQLYIGGRGSCEQDHGNVTQQVRLF